MVDLVSFGKPSWKISNCGFVTGDLFHLPPKYVQFLSRPHTAPHFWSFFQVLDVFGGSLTLTKHLMQCAHPQYATCQALLVDTSVVGTWKSPSGIYDFCWHWRSRKPTKNGWSSRSLDGFPDFRVTAYNFPAAVAMSNTYVSRRSKLSCKLWQLQRGSSPRL